MKESGDGLTAADFILILGRRKVPAALIAMAVLGAAATYAAVATPVYRAVALLNIERVSDVVGQNPGYQPPDEEYFPTQAQLIASESALSRVYEELGLGKTDEFAGGLPAFRKAVTVLAVPRTRLCFVNAESVDPKRAAAISNALAESYLRRNLDNQLFMPKEVLNALRTRAKGPRAQKIYETLPAVITNQLIQQIKGQILEREVAVAELRARYTDEHPSVRATKEQLRLMREARDREVDNVVQSLTTALSGQLRPNNVRIIDQALPPSIPARPRKALALLLGLVGGVGLGILGAVALESLDQTVRTQSDLEHKLGLPFLGEIPLWRPTQGGSATSLLTSAVPTPASRAFRDLRTVVGLANQRDADPFLLVTSTTELEGKSFVATNLAVALSQFGQKVLIIDADLRRGLGEAGAQGLSDFLSGRVDDPHSILTATDVPNLQSIAAGTSCQNASELLQGRRLAELVEWARGRFDRVIVDCPPVFPAGDVLSWGRLIRRSILVSRCGRTPMPLISLACSRLSAGGIDLVGSVLNGSQSGALSDVYRGS